MFINFIKYMFLTDVEWTAVFKYILNIPQCYFFLIIDVIGYKITRFLEIQVLLPTLILLRSWHLFQFIYKYYRTSHVCIYTCNLRLPTFIKQNIGYQKAVFYEE